MRSLNWVNCWKANLQWEYANQQPSLGMAEKYQEGSETREMSSLDNKSLQECPD